MTEEEAKTKLCFRAATFGASQQLADGPGPLCVGSACMAWSDVVRLVIRRKDDGSRVPSGTRYLLKDVDSSMEPVGGRCGLVGRSE